MSLDHIREAIVAEAEAEARRIENTAKANREERLDAARRALKAEFARRLERAQQDGRQESQRRLILRRSEHNLNLLKRRNEILDGLFARAAEQFAGLPARERCAVVGGWMKALPQDTGGTVLCHERDHARLALLVAELNRSRGEQARLVLERSDGALSGGIIFRSRKFEINLSADARLKRLRELLAPEAARIVFSGELTV